MVDDLLKLILQPSSQPKSVTVTIPNDHPHADKLLRLVARLVTAATTPSGLMVSQAVLDGDDRVWTFLRALREIALEDGLDFDSMLTSLFESNQVSGPQALANPKVLGAALDAVLSGKFTLDPEKVMDSRLRNNYANVVQKLMA